MVALALGGGGGGFAPPPPPQLAEMAAPLSFGDLRKKKEDEIFVFVGKGGEIERIQ